MAPRSLSPSPARSLPLPRHLRCPRRAPLRLTGGRRCRRGRGRGRGFPGRGGAERGGRLSVRLDGQWLLPATSPHANRLLPPGHGLSRREASIVPALPGLLVAGTAATFLKEARRASERRNSVTAGSRHESPRPAQGSSGVSRHSRCPHAPPRSLGPSAARGGSQCFLPAAPRPGGPARPRAGSSEQVSHRLLRTEGSRCASQVPPPEPARSPGRCLSRRTEGRTDGRAASVLPLRFSGRLHLAAVAWGVLAVRTSQFAPPPPPRPRVLGF